MPDLYWFGVSIGLACPACHRTSAEQLALSTDRSDPASINQVINCQKLACQLCKVPLPSGTEVNVRVEPGAPERLRRLGYPVPPGVLGAITVVDSDGAASREYSHLKLGGWP